MPRICVKRSLSASSLGNVAFCVPALPTLTNTAHQHREDLDMVGHLFLFTLLGAWDTECACLNDSACLRLNSCTVQVSYNTSFAVGQVQECNIPEHGKWSQAPQLQRERLGLP